MKTRDDKKNIQLLLGMILGMMLILSCNFITQLPFFGGEESADTSLSGEQPRGLANESDKKPAEPTIERISIGEKNIIKIPMGGLNFLLKLVAPDLKDLSGLQVNALAMGGQKMVVVEDPNGVYLPEIVLLSDDDPEEVIIPMKVSQVGEDEFLNSGSTLRRNLVPGALIQAYLGETTLAGLENFLGVDYTSRGLGVILGLIDGMDENTRLRVFRTFYQGIYLAVPVDLLSGYVPTAGEEFSLERPYPDFILTQSMILQRRLPPTAGLLTRFREQTQTVDLFDFRGFSLDDINWLRSRAIARFMQKDGTPPELEGLLASDLPQEIIDLITRYIESATLVDSSCANPDDVGVIFAQYPAAGTSFVPSTTNLTLHYCSGLSTEPLKIFQVRFSLPSGHCPALETPPVVDVVLVIDVSGSMQGDRLAVAKSAAIQFINQLNSETDRIGLVSFESDASQLSDLTSNFSSVSGMIGGFEASGGTAIDAGLSAGHRIIQNSSRTEAERVIMLLTDGGSDPAAAMAAANQIKADGITLLAVGVGPGTDQALLQSLASSPDDSLFSNTNQGLKVLFDETAKRLTGNFLARNISMKLKVDTTNYSIIESMLTGDSVMATQDTVEWTIPFLFEGEPILKPVVLRPLNSKNEPIGTVQITFNECYDGPNVVLEPMEVDAGSIELASMSGDVLEGGSTGSGKLEPFKSFGFVLDIQEPGLYSIVVRGAGSAYAPEIFNEDGKVKLNPLYTIPEGSESTSSLPPNGGKRMKPTWSATVARTSVYYVKEPELFWLYIQSNSEEDAGDFSIELTDGAVDVSPDFNIGDTITTAMIQGQSKVYNLMGVSEGDILSIISRHSEENSYGYGYVISLDGEVSFSKYYMYYYGADEDRSKFTRVYEVLGKGPYKLVFNAPDGDASLEVVMGDTLLNFEGDIQYGDTQRNTIPAYSVDAWYFEGAAGEGVSISLRDGEYFWLLGPEWEDQFISSYAYNYEGAVKMGPFEIPVQGTYSIVIRNSDDGVSKPYQLTLERVSLPEPILQPISIGEVVTNQYIGGREDQYTFVGVAGQAITIEMVIDEEDYYFYPELKVLGPDGDVLQETQSYYQTILLGPFTLPVDGTYTILVSGSFTGGNYELTLK